MNAKKSVLPVLLGSFVLAMGLIAAVSVRANPLPGGTLDPASIDQYQDPLVIPPAMPRTGKIKVRMGKNVDYYEIAVRQFQQQILPAPLLAQGVRKSSLLEYKES